MIHGRPVGRRACLIVAWAIAVCVAGASMCGVVARATAAAPVSVGVVDFYSPTPLPVIGAVIPERSAADQLAALLARASGANGPAVVPRAAVERAEASMHWRNDDVLSFDRLGRLARALGADRLVVGWLPIMTGGGGGGTIIPEGGGGDGDGVSAARAEAVVQLFDADQGRIVGETRSFGYAATGVVPGLTSLELLRNTLAPTVPWLMSQLAPAGVEGEGRRPAAAAAFDAAR